jgi:hypothetical protein
MEKRLGRPLKRSEIVHHKDEDNQNNEDENLVLCQGLREHLDTYHAKDLVAPPIHHNSRRKIKLGPMKEKRKLHPHAGGKM